MASIGGFNPNFNQISGRPQLKKSIPDAQKEAKTLNLESNAKPHEGLEGPKDDDTKQAGKHGRLGWGADGKIYEQGKDNIWRIYDGPDKPREY